MPQVFDAGGTATGGLQAYQSRKNSLELQKLAIAEANARRAEYDAMRSREAGAREAWGQAVQALGQMQDAQPDEDPLGAVETPDLAQVGVGRNAREVQAWLKGKDDPTAQALSVLKARASRIAEDDPEAAMLLLQQGTEQLKGRVMQQAQARFQEKFSNKIQAISQAIASGSIGETDGAMVQEQLQMAMEAVETNPAVMAKGEEILAKAHATLKEGMVKQATKQRALGDLDALEQTGVDKKLLDGARADIELGEDPDKVVEELKVETSKWKGGPIEKAPQTERAKWHGEAMSLARAYAQENLPREPGEAGPAYIQRLLTAANEMLPVFLDEVQSRAGVVKPVGVRRPVIPGWTEQIPGAVQPAGQPKRPSLDDVLAGKMEGQLPPGGAMGYAIPASGNAFAQQPQQTQQPAAPQGEAAVPTEQLAQLKAQPPKKRRGEDVGPYVARVLKAVEEAGGSEQDAAEILEAAGLTAETVEGAPY